MKIFRFIIFKNKRDDFEKQMDEQLKYWDGVSAKDLLKRTTIFHNAVLDLAEAAELPPAIIAGALDTVTEYVMSQEKNKLTTDAMRMLKKYVDANFIKKESMENEKKVE